MFVVAVKSRSPLPVVYNCFWAMLLLVRGVGRRCPLLVFAVVAVRSSLLISVCCCGCCCGSCCGGLLLLMVGFGVAVVAAVVVRVCIVVVVCRCSLFWVAVGDRHEVLVRTLCGC